MTITRMIVNNSYESIIYELDQAKKQLMQKDTENQELKRKVFEWKKMALENESLFQTARQQYQIEEQNLIARHKSEMDALTNAHVEKMNDVSKTILSLQQSQHENHHPSSKHIHNLIEDRYKETASKVIYHRQKATKLILNMNELMTEIEIKIQGYVDDDVNANKNNDAYLNHRTLMSTESINEPPPLDPSLSQHDTDDFHHQFQKNTTASFSSLSSSSLYDSPASSRSSISIEPISPPNRPQHYPRLKTKPTMEQLTKVIPNFFIKKHVQ